ncbi:copper homeostasis CutC domain-containing protein [Mrakia frigida]|uniref:copper homeostasis protein CutC n=1 Tax=Mrakia frigida TaxID=29902 RepID=UPI003FCC1D7B
MLLEVCVDSFDSAKTAVDNGADRLEICGPLGIGGGTSPSFALVKKIHRAFPSTPLVVMVRPRPGDFVYSSSELELMKDEIDLLKSVVPSVMGVVLGCLLPNGRIDVNSTRSLVERAHPLEVTFHRAFDMTFSSGAPALEAHALTALEDLHSIPGITRILTSSLGPSLPSSFHVFSALVQHRRRIVLLPGSGINPTSLRAPIPSPSPSLPPIDHPSSISLPASSKEEPPSLLAALRCLGIQELHASCSSFVEGPVLPEARKEGMGMGPWERWEVRGEVVREMRALLDGGD